MNKHLSDEEFLFHWIVTNSKDAPSAERVRLYRALALQVPSEAVRDRLLKLAEEIASIDRSTDQLSLNLLFPEDQERNS